MRVAIAIAGTAALAATGCTSAGSGASGASRRGAPAPAVTAAAAASAYNRVVAAYLAAPATADHAAALSSATDVAWVELNTSYQIARRLKRPAPAGVVRLGRPAFYLPEPAGYPQWFVAKASVTLTGARPSPGTRVIGAPGGAQWVDSDGTALLLFTKASATGEWKLSSDSRLAPGASVPALASDAAGRVPVVSLSDNSALLTRPDFTGSLQAGVVDDGPASPAARVVASGPLTTGVYDSERAGLFGLSAPRGDVLQWELEGSNYPQFALRTANGGALVFYAMYLNTTVQTPGSLAHAEPPNTGPPISVSTAISPLLTRGKRAPRTELQGQQLLSFAAVDPPGSTGKIAAIAIGGGWSFASAT